MQFNIIYEAQEETNLWALHLEDLFAWWDWVSTIMANIEDYVCRERKKSSLLQLTSPTFSKHTVSMGGGGRELDLLLIIGDGAL